MAGWSVIAFWVLLGLALAALVLLTDPVEFFARNLLAQPEHLRYLAYALVGMVNSVVFKWGAEDDLKPLGPKADWLVELFWRAAGADGG